MSNKLKSKKEPKELKELKWTTVGREFTGYLLDLMLCIYMLLVIVVMPFYHQEGFIYIGTNKAMFFRQISISAAWFILPVLVIYLLLWFFENRNKYKLRELCKKQISVTDCFALIYCASLILSYISSSYQDNALWGANGWFMGLLPQLFLLAIYFLVSRFWEVRGWLLLLFLPVSAAVFGLGFLNRFGIFPIDMGMTNVQFISTIGNINWYCGYLVSVFFGGYYLLWKMDPVAEKNKGWKQALLMLYVAVGFATLVTQGSMSGLFTLAVMLVVTFCLSAGNSRRMQMFWQEVLLLSLVCLLTLGGRKLLGWQITYTDGVVDLLTYSLFPVVMTMVAAVFVGMLFYWEKRGKYPEKLFKTLAKLLVICIGAAMCVVIVMITVNTLHPGSLGPLSEYSVFTFSPTWGSNRATTWRAGLMCFAEQNLLHKLVGVGPDGMSAYLYTDGSSKLQQMVTDLFGTDSLTNAHNEWITVLVNTGILGCVGFVGMMVSGIWSYIKRGLALGNVTHENITRENLIRKKLALGACGFCLLAYTVNNMFSFQQSMSAATIFVILGAGEAISRQIRKSKM